MVARQGAQGGDGLPEQLKSLVDQLVAEHELKLRNLATENECIRRDLASKNESLHRTLAAENEWLRRKVLDLSQRRQESARPHKEPFPAEPGPCAPPGEAPKLYCGSSSSSDQTPSSVDLGMEQRPVVLPGAPSSMSDDDDSIVPALIPGSRTSASRPAEEPPEMLVEDLDEAPKVATVSGDQSLEQDQALLYHMQHKELSVKAAQKEKARAARRPKPWTLSSRFNMVVGLVIMLNALSMGLEADYGILAPAVFLGLEHFFAAAFLLELLLHLWAEGWQMYFGDRANWLDFGLVVMSVSDIWIIQQIGIEADMRLMSLMRLIRLTRLARLLRLFRIFKELTLIIEGFMAGAKALTWSFLFLLIMVYIFAIFARLQIGSRYVCSDDETEVSEGVACPADAGGGMPVTLFAFNPEIGTQQQLFGSMELTMLTLFICLSEGCGVEIIHPTVRRSPLLFAYWLIFVVTTTFGILNLIVGIFCENMMKIALETERDIMRSQEDVRRQKLEELRRAFQRMDNDGSGNISREEFSEAIVQNNEVINAMVALGLDEEKDLFDAIDADHSGSLEFNEFFDGVTLIMKGQEPALAKDMVATYLRVCGLAKANGRLEKRLHALGGEQQQAYVRIETRLDELLRPPAQARETVLEALPGN